MAKLLYTMGEVADMLSEAPSAVRYWSNYFEKYVKPQRNAKGNRLYHPEDIETLKQIQFMVKNQGLTLEGAMQRLKEDHRSVDRRVKALDSLKAIRKHLFYALVNTLVQYFSFHRTACDIKIIDWFMFLGSFCFTFGSACPP